MISAKVNLTAVLSVDTAARLSYIKGQFRTPSAMARVALEEYVKRWEALNGRIPDEELAEHVEAQFRRARHGRKRDADGEREV